MVIKPETDQELLKLIEDIESIANHAMADIYEDTKIASRLRNIIERSKACQEYVRAKLNVNV